MHLLNSITLLVTQVTIFAGPVLLAAWSYRTARPDLARVVLQTRLCRLADRIDCDRARPPNFELVQYGRAPRARTPAVLVARQLSGRTHHRRLPRAVGRLSARPVPLCCARRGYALT